MSSNCISNPDIVLLVEVSPDSIQTEVESRCLAVLGELGIGHFEFSRLQGEKGTFTLKIKLEEEERARVVEIGSSIRKALKGTSGVKNVCTNEIKAPLEPASPCEGE